MLVSAHQSHREMWMHWDGNTAHPFPWAWHSWKPKALHRGGESVHAQRQSCKAPLNINTQSPDYWTSIWLMCGSPQQIIWEQRSRRVYDTRKEVRACNWRQKYKMYRTWILFSTFLGGLYYSRDMIRKQPLEQNICFKSIAGRVGIQIIWAGLFTSKTEGVRDMFIQLIEMGAMYH